MGQDSAPFTPFHSPDRVPRVQTVTMRFPSLRSLTGQSGPLRPKGRSLKLMAGLCVGLSHLSATDLTIHLPDAVPVVRQKILYQCDALGSQIGVPVSPFWVEHITGGGNSLVIVPIAGNALIFSTVSSDSGARYKTQQYTWWEAKNTAILFSDSLTGKLQTSCHPVSHK